ncbi:glycoside hydrolase family 3 protein [Streptomyces sp. P9-A2]|uniref:glycoside hydrolase family 3 protein n=1 Tax=Streptomyces sp. P9-A2 TaxID=3072284 RepID=UPI003FCE9E09
MADHGRIGGNPRLLRLAHSVLQPGFTGSTVPDWVRRRISEGLASVALSGRNIHGPEQVAALTSALHAENPDLVIGLDEEADGEEAGGEEAGGATRPDARTGAFRPGNRALGALDNIDVTEQVAHGVGRDLHTLGITLSYTPSADVAPDPYHPVIGVRSFGARTDVVSRHAAAWVRGLQSAGVAACAKHFPGHGDTVVSRRLGLPQVPARAGTVALTALPPFIAAMDAGVRAVMTGHLLVPAYDDRRPATLSRAVTQDLLRGELGFTGLIVTDAIEMGAVADRYGVAGATVRAVAAGADAVCVGGGHGHADERTTARLADALVRAVRDGRLPEERLTEAASRVQEFARWSGGLRRDATGDRAEAGAGLGPVTGPAAARRAAVRSI